MSVAIGHDVRAALGFLRYVFLLQSLAAALSILARSDDHVVSLERLRIVHLLPFKIRAQPHSSVRRVCMELRWGMKPRKPSELLPAHMQSKHPADSKHARCAAPRLHGVYESRRSVPKRAEPVPSMG